MDTVLNFLNEYRGLIEIGVLVVLCGVGKIFKGKYMKYLDAASIVARTAYSAIEDSKDIKQVKKQVVDTIADLGKRNKVIYDVNDAMAAVVDEKKADKKIPAIKRFWRRLLAGQNLAGVVARVALQTGAQNLLKGRVK